MGETARSALPALKKIMTSQSGQTGSICSAAVAHWRISGSSETAWLFLQGMLRSPVWLDRADAALAMRNLQELNERQLALLKRLASEKEPMLRVRRAAQETLRLSDAR
jgi:hypothetical protein